MMATYTNRPISKAFQLAELKNRGLVVGDDNQAIEHLGSINYFRFACYLQPFEIDPATHQYAGDAPAFPFRSSARERAPHRR